MPATKDVYIRPSRASPEANCVYIRPHKENLYSCLVGGYTFPYFTYKPLDIIEIMSNCNNNKQGRIYTSTLQGFSKTLISDVHFEIHILQRNASLTLFWWLYY